MNTILLVTTICAVAVAVAAGFALVLAYRQERRRSEARVIALQQLAAGADPAAPQAIAFDDFDVYEDPDMPARPMFSGARERAPWGRRAIAAAAVALIVFVAGSVLLPRDGDPAERTSASQPTAPLPLELLSLRHTPESGRLVITGLVQNPRGGTPLTRVIATAFLFGADGTFLASGRAPLDFSTLAAGDESPFVVAVPVTSPVARYRIGFRSESGQVIAHIDRRAANTLARTGE